MQTVTQQMVILGFCMLIGFLARKNKIMNDTLDTGLSGLILKVTLPCMIIGAVICRESLPTPQAIATMVASSWACYGLILLIAYTVPRLMMLERGKRGTYSFMFAFGNTGFIGFPVCNAIFGQESILVAAIFNIPFNMLVFTLGIMMLQQDEEPFLKQLKSHLGQLRSPALVACFAALILALLGVCNTGFVGEAVSTLGSMTTPAAMLIIGSNLAKVPIASLVNQLRPYIMAFIRLLVTPILVWLVFRNFISDPIILGVLTITTGMPVATNGTLLCLQYGGDTDTIVRGTVISTIISLFTIPLLTTIIS